MERRDSWLLRESGHYVRGRQGAFSRERLMMTSGWWCSLSEWTRMASVKYVTTTTTLDESWIVVFVHKGETTMTKEDEERGWNSVMIDRKMVGRWREIECSKSINDGSRDASRLVKKEIEICLWQIDKELCLAPLGILEATSEAEKTERITDVGWSLVNGMLKTTFVMSVLISLAPVHILLFPQGTKVWRFWHQ